MNSNIISIRAISRILENNRQAKKAFKWAIGAVLFLLEQQKLINGRDLEKVSLDFERGVIDLGDTFTQKVFARAIGEYVIDRKIKRTRYIATGIQESKKAQDELSTKKDQS